MIIDELREKEPIAYQSIGNALRENKVAHSYLFSGEYSPLKIETAYLLAMSIIEGKNDFACETCDTCRRIRSNSYFDVIYVDGYRELIKKDDVTRIMDEFSRTSLESSGKKVYILANINNSSAKVLNMILKFMEEPANANTYGIFISDKKEDLLPTVVSRCQEVPFLTRDFSFLMERYEENGFDHLDAYLLSHMLHRFDPEFDLNDQRYLNAKEFVYRFIESLDQKESIPVLFSSELYPCFKDRDDLKSCCDYFLNIMIKMLEDAIEGKQVDDRGYMDKLEELRRHDVVGLLEIMENASDKTISNAERKLLFDSIAYEIISYK